MGPGTSRLQLCYSPMTAHWTGYSSFDPTVVLLTHYMFQAFWLQAGSTDMMYGSQTATTFTYFYARNSNGSRIQPFCSDCARRKRLLWLFPVFLSSFRALWSCSSCAPLTIDTVTTHMAYARGGRKGTWVSHTDLMADTFTIPFLHSNWHVLGWTRNSHKPSPFRWGVHQPWNCRM